MSAYYDRIANAYGTPYTVHGTAYELRDPQNYEPGFSPQQLTDALASGFLAANIRRCCDGDHHGAQATLPDRYTTTLEDALRWRAHIDASGHDPDTWRYPA